MNETTIVIREDAVHALLTTHAEIGVALKRIGERRLRKAEHVAFVALESAYIVLDRLIERRDATLALMWVGIETERLARLAIAQPEPSPYLQEMNEAIIANRRVQDMFRDPEALEAN